MAKAHKKTPHFTLKTIASCLVLCLVAEQAAFAAPELKALRWDDSEKPALHFKIPASVATIEDSWNSPQPPSLIKEGGEGGVLVYLIQDAHTNASGQFNLAKTLDILFANEKGLKTVFVEAGSGDDSLDFLKPYSTAAERERVAKSWVKKGVLHGEEYLNLTTDHKMVLWGVEDMPLYSKAIDAYRRTAKERERLQNYLKTVSSAIGSLKPRLMNPALLSFDALRERYIKEALPLTEYAEALLAEAGKRGIAREVYAHLSGLKDLKVAETGIDFTKANEEQAKALQSLEDEVRSELMELAEKEKTPFKFSSNEDGGERAFYAALEEALGPNAADIFPELFKYFAYLESAKRLDPRRVLNEIKALEAEVLDVLARTPDEKRFVQCQQVLSALQKLLDLTLTPEEYAEYEKSAENFTIKHLTGFLNKKIMDLGTLYERAPFLEEGFDEAVANAETFYRLTRDRDEAFLKNMAAKLAAEPQNKVALIVGGFHAPNLKALFREKNISYVSIQPQVLQETNHKKYEQILFDQAPAAARLNTLASPVRSMARTLMLNEATQGARFVAEFANYASRTRVSGARVDEQNVGARASSLLNLTTVPITSFVAFTDVLTKLNMFDLAPHERGWFARFMFIVGLPGLLYVQRILVNSEIGRVTLGFLMGGMIGNGLEMFTTGVISNPFGPLFGYYFNFADVAIIFGLVGTFIDTFVIPGQKLDETKDASGARVEKNQAFVLKGNGFQQSVKVVALLPELDAVKLEIKGFDSILTTTAGVQSKRNGLRPFDLSIGTTFHLSSGVTLTLNNVDAKAAEFNLSNPDAAQVQLTGGARASEPKLYDHRLPALIRAKARELGDYTEANIRTLAEFIEKHLHKPLLAERLARRMLTPPRHDMEGLEAESLRRKGNPFIRGARTAISASAALDPKSDSSPAEVDLDTLKPFVRDSVKLARDVEKLVVPMTILDMHPKMTVYAQESHPIEGRFGKLDDWEHPKYFSLILEDGRIHRSELDIFVTMNDRALTDEYTAALFTFLRSPDKTRLPRVLEDFMLEELDPDHRDFQKLISLLARIGVEPEYGKESNKHARVHLWSILKKYPTAIEPAARALISELRSRDVKIRATAVSYLQRIGIGLKSVAFLIRAERDRTHDVVQQALLVSLSTQLKGDLDPLMSIENIRVIQSSHSGNYQIARLDARPLLEALDSFIDEDEDEATAELVYLISPGGQKLPLFVRIITDDMEYMLFRHHELYPFAKVQELYHRYLAGNRQTQPSFVTTKGFLLHIEGDLQAGGMVNIGVDPDASKFLSMTPVGARLPELKEVIRAQARENGELINRYKKGQKVGLQTSREMNWPHRVLGAGLVDTLEGNVVWHAKVVDVRPEANALTVRLLQADGSPSGAHDFHWDYDSPELGLWIWQGPTKIHVGEITEKTSTNRIDTKREAERVLQWLIEVYKDKEFTLAILARDARLKLLNARTGELLTGEVSRRNRIESVLARLVVNDGPIERIAYLGKQVDKYKVKDEWLSAEGSRLVESGDSGDVYWAADNATAVLPESKVRKAMAELRSIAGEFSSLAEKNAKIAEALWSASNELEKRIGKPYSQLGEWLFELRRTAADIERSEFKELAPRVIEVVKSFTRSKNNQWAPLTPRPNERAAAAKKEARAASKPPTVPPRPIVLKPIERYASISLAAAKGEQKAPSQPRAPAPEKQARTKIETLAKYMIDRAEEHGGRELQVLQNLLAKDRTAAQGRQLTRLFIRYSLRFTDEDVRSKVIAEVRERLNHPSRKTLKDRIQGARVEKGRLMIVPAEGPAEFKLGPISQMLLSMPKEEALTSLRTLYPDSIITDVPLAATAHYHLGQFTELEIPKGAMIRFHIGGDHRPFVGRPFKINAEDRITEKAKGKEDALVQWEGQLDAEGHVEVLVTQDISPKDFSILLPLTTEDIPAFEAASLTVPGIDIITFKEQAGENGARTAAQMIPHGRIETNSFDGKPLSVATRPSGVAMKLSVISRGQDIFVGPWVYYGGGFPYVGKSDSFGVSHHFLVFKDGNTLNLFFLGNADQISDGVSGSAIIASGAIKSGELDLFHPVGNSFYQVKSVRFDETGSLILEHENGQIAVIDLELASRRLGAVLGARASIELKEIRVPVSGVTDVQRRVETNFPVNFRVAQIGAEGLVEALGLSLTDPKAELVYWKGNTSLEPMFIFVTGSQEGQRRRYIVQAGSDVYNIAAFQKEWPSDIRAHRVAFSLMAKEYLNDPSIEKIEAEPVVVGYLRSLEGDAVEKGTLKLGVDPLRVTAGGRLIMGIEELRVYLSLDQVSIINGSELIGTSGIRALIERKEYVRALERLRDLRVTQAALKKGAVVGAITKVIEALEPHAGARVSGKIREALDAVKGDERFDFVRMRFEELYTRFAAFEDGEAMPAGELGNLIADLSFQVGLVSTKFDLKDKSDLFEDALQTAVSMAVHGSSPPSARAAVVRASRQFISDMYKEELAPIFSVYRDSSFSVYQVSVLLGGVPTLSLGGQFRRAKNAGYLEMIVKRGRRGGTILNRWAFTAKAKNEWGVPGARTSEQTLLSRAWPAACLYFSAAAMASLVVGLNPFHPLAILLTLRNYMIFKENLIFMGERELVADLTLLSSLIRISDRLIDDGKIDGVTFLFDRKDLLSAPRSFIIFSGFKPWDKLVMRWFIYSGLSASGDFRLETAPFHTDMGRFGNLAVLVPSDEILDRWDLERSGARADDPNAPNLLLERVMRLQSGDKVSLSYIDLETNEHHVKTGLFQRHYDESQQISVVIGGIVHIFNLVARGHNQVLVIDKVGARTATLAEDVVGIQADFAGYLKQKGWAPPSARASNVDEFIQKGPNYDTVDYPTKILSLMRHLSSPNIRRLSKSTIFDSDLNAGTITYEDDGSVELILHAEREFNGMGRLSLAISQAGQLHGSYRLTKPRSILSLRDLVSIDTRGARTAMTRDEAFKNSVTIVDRALEMLIGEKTPSLERIMRLDPQIGYAAKTLSDMRIQFEKNVYPESAFSMFLARLRRSDLGLVDTVSFVGHLEQIKQRMREAARDPKETTARIKGFIRSRKGTPAIIAFNDLSSDQVGVFQSLAEKYSIDARSDEVGFTAPISNGRDYEPFLSELAEKGLKNGWFTAEPVSDRLNIYQVQPTLGARVTEADGEQAEVRAALVMTRDKVDAAYGRLARKLFNADIPISFKPRLKRDLRELNADTNYALNRQAVSAFRDLPEASNISARRLILADRLEAFDRIADRAVEGMEFLIENSIQGARVDEEDMLLPKDEIRRIAQAFEDLYLSNVGDLGLGFGRISGFLGKDADSGNVVRGSTIGYIVDILQGLARIGRYDALTQEKVADVLGPLAERVIAAVESQGARTAEQAVPAITSLTDSQKKHLVGQYIQDRFGNASNTALFILRGSRRMDAVIERLGQGAKLLDIFSPTIDADQKSLSVYPYPAATSAGSLMLTEVGGFSTSRRLTADEIRELDGVVGFSEIHRRLEPVFLGALDNAKQIQEKIERSEQFSSEVRALAAQLAGIRTLIFDTTDELHGSDKPLQREGARLTESSPAWTVPSVPRDIIVSPDGRIVPAAQQPVPLTEAAPQGPDALPAELPAPTAEFLKSVGARLSGAAVKSIALLDGDTLDIFDLKNYRSNDILVKLTRGGEERYFRLDTDAEEPLSTSHDMKAKRSDYLLTTLVEDASRDNLQKPSASAGNSSKDIFVHLDSFPVFDKSMISNLLYQLNQRMSDGTTIVLVGSPERRASAMDYIRQMGLNKSSRFIEETSLPRRRKNHPAAHLATQGYQSSKVSTAKWIFLQNAGDFEVGIFAFAPVQSLLELVAAGQIDEALEFFRTITPHKDITKAEFLAFLAGDPAMQERYAIRFLDKVDLRTAIRAYQLTRIVDINA